MIHTENSHAPKVQDVVFKSSRSLCAAFEIYFLKRDKIQLFLCLTKLAGLQDHPCGITWRTAVRSILFRATSTLSSNNPFFKSSCWPRDGQLLETCVRPRHSGWAPWLSQCITYLYVCLSFSCRKKSHTSRCAWQLHLSGLLLYNHVEEVYLRTTLKTVLTVSTALLFLVSLNYSTRLYQLLTISAI